MVTFMMFAEAYPIAAMCGLTALVGCVLRLF